MEKSQKIVQIYGYTVCLVALITFLIAISTLVNSVMDKSDPLHSGFTPAGTPSLASYENYKMDILKNAPKENDATKISNQPDDNTLRAMYQSAKDDKIQSSLHDIKKSIMVETIMLVLSIIIFISHWIWMGKIMKAEK